MSLTRPQLPCSVEAVPPISFSVAFSFALDRADLLVLAQAALYGPVRLHGVVGQNVLVSLLSPAAS